MLRAQGGTNKGEVDIWLDRYASAERYTPVYHWPTRGGEKDSKRYQD